MELPLLQIRKILIKQNSLIDHNIFNDDKKAQPFGLAE